ncbi:hypothetical protein ASF11_14555 [Acidovorax sp. Leaf76]|uniref:hypothetical protein n=1 Tax=unclassified Acidovorax TaxID=2684926 RepID=UPI0006F49048|nr:MULTISPECIES: hypothetical protein [unclassified Acidovorax]KQO14036.1 hypothetical protein ASF11_14555 [Acidovorax sp. Leaf76]KQO15476.1 hypothetical protein ASF16_16115 [Acidovorax sp. Leaf78]KQO31556.1 hypothetical protein ASF19_12250 [Acidovorax sp. Leaf84]KQS27575.1 hypothetical protein ASG27_16385 [Acidovorax sp. Leaf191]
MNEAPLDIKALLTSAEEVFLEETGWLDDCSPEELERTYTDFASRFRTWRARLAESLGPPSVTRERAPDLAEELYFEAFELAAWPKDHGYLVLACGQHDRESPIFVSFGYREPNGA